jgi:hypothetical protein
MYSWITAWAKRSRGTSRLVRTMGMYPAGFQVRNTGSSVSSARMARTDSSSWREWTALRYSSDVVSRQKAMFIRHIPVSRSSRVRRRVRLTSIGPICSIV